MRWLLCLLGLHRWTVHITERYYDDRVCEECGHGKITYNFKKHQREYA